MKTLQGQDNHGSSPNRRHSRSAFQLTCLVLAIAAVFIVTHGSAVVAELILLHSDSQTEMGLHLYIFTI